jgi:dolichol-phosphate mannosyltransferase
MNHAVPGIRPGPELSIVVPTFNERENVAELLRLLEASLAGISWEVIFVDDDSKDGTGSIVCALAQRDARVRCLQRIGRRGLASACIEGFLSSSAPYLAVMDADLQHDERILPAMLAVLRRGDTDIAIGSRNIPGGAAHTDHRRDAMSRFAARLSRTVLPADLKDPMSGFFMTRREVVQESAHRLSAIGFKILLDLFASSTRPLRFCEIPYTFRERSHGESKLEPTVMWDYLLLLLDKIAGRFVPARFLSFLLIGSLGFVVHMSVLAGALKMLQAPFARAQAAATVIAMTVNFLLNNLLTYRDQRLRGWRMLSGLLMFYAACGLGAIANVGVATAVFERHYQWWLAGFAGVLIGAVWNYVATAKTIWRGK